MMGMAGFATAGDDKGVWLNFIAFAVAFVGMGDKGADEVAARFEATFDLVYALLNDIHRAVIDNVPGEDQVKEIIFVRQFSHVAGGQVEHDRFIRRPLIGVRKTICMILDG